MGIYFCLKILFRVLGELDDLGVLSGSVLDYFALAVFLHHSGFIHHRQHHGNASQPAGRHPIHFAQQGFQVLFKLAVIHKHTVRTVGFQNGQHIRHKLLARQIFLVFLLVGSAAGVHLFQLFKIRLIENAGVTGEVAAGPQTLDALCIQHTPALQRLIDRILLVHKLLVGENLAVLVFLKIGVQLSDFYHAIPVDFATLFAQRFTQGLPHIHRIDQLHLSTAVRALVAGQDKDINTDVGVIEKLGGQSNNGFN